MTPLEIVRNEHHMATAGLNWGCDVGTCITCQSLTALNIDVITAEYKRCVDDAIKQIFAGGMYLKVALRSDYVCMSLYKNNREFMFSTFNESFERSIEAVFEFLAESKK